VNTPSEHDWAAAVALLGSARSVALACHIGPDGDALGSMLALAGALRHRGIDVVASWGCAPGEPFAIPSSYDFLKGEGLLVPPERFPAAPDVLVTLDTGSADRLGVLADRVGAAGHVLVIDHHPTNTRYGTLHLLDDDAAATALLVARLIERLDLPLTEDVAVALYTGLVTDTGSFRYRATTPEVHELAARLLATGFRHDLVNRAIWDTAPVAFVRLLGEVCARTRLESDAVGGLGLVWTAVTADDLGRHGLGLSDIEGVIDVIRVAREAEVALVLKQEPDARAIKVSLRSKGAIDVGAVCASLGGGGHRFAAGLTSSDDVENTVAALRTALATAPHLPA
jgi:phosphoesterase RecJ-like protein